MIRVWSYVYGEDITDRGLSFPDAPIRAGNLTPRGLYYHAYLSHKTPVIHPYSISRWHNNDKYTEEMHLVDAWNHMVSNPNPELYGKCVNKECNNKVDNGTGSEQCKVCLFKQKYELIKTKSIDKDGWYTYFFKQIGSVNYGIYIQCVHELTDEQSWDFFIKFKGKL